MNTKTKNTKPNSKKRKGNTSTREDSRYPSDKASKGRRETTNYANYNASFIEDSEDSYNRDL